MALTRAKKAQKVEALAQELAGSTSAIVGTFAKLTVSQDFALRQKVREAGGRYRVLKNKLAARASQGTGIESALQGLKGVSSVAYTSGDPVALAKALSAWVKENAEFTFKLGIVEGKVITVEEVQSLATMPGKDEIYAKLLFLISAPAQRLATVINATGRDLAVVLGQGVEKEKFVAAPAASAPAAEKAEAVPAPAVVSQEAAPAAVAEAPITVAETPMAAAEAPALAEVGREAVVAETATGISAPEAPAVEAPAVEGSSTESAAEASIAEAAAPIEAHRVAETPSMVEEAEADPTEVAGSEKASEAPAPAEGPAAEGRAAEVSETQAEAASSEASSEG